MSEAVGPVGVGEGEGVGDGNDEGEGDGAGDPSKLILKPGPQPDWLKTLKILNARTVASPNLRPRCPAYARGLIHPF